MVTKKRFEQGMTASEYVAQMTMNKERLLASLQSATLAPREAGVLERLAGTRHILVITEDWCGAAIASLPYVMKLVEGAPHVDLRIFLRDENPDLMDQFLKDGQHRSIPVFAFFDENMNEVARLIERPGKITEQLEKKMLEVRRSMRAENLAQWRQDVVGEVRNLLKA